MLNTRHGTPIISATAPAPYILSTYIRLAGDGLDVRKVQALATFAEAVEAVHAQADDQGADGWSIKYAADGVGRFPWNPGEALDGARCVIRGHYVSPCATAGVDVWEDAQGRRYDVGCVAGHGYTICRHDAAHHYGE